MCNSIIIETHYTYEEVWQIFDEIFGKEYRKEHYADVHWIYVGNFNEVAINGFNDKCFCSNIEDVDKIKLFDFILRISNVLT